MLTVIAFIVIFGAIVIIHEAGHFTVAKLSRVHVQEFGIGFPPRLLQFRKGETVYTLNAIPLGGFVKMLGEEDPTAPRSLASKPVPVRALVISAGALMNLVLAVFLFSVVAMVPQDALAGGVRVKAVADGSPAAAAGLMPGDLIRKVNGQPVENLSELSYQVRLRLGATTTMQIDRNGQRISKDLVPRWQPPAGQGATGIEIEMVDPHIVRQSKSVFPAIGHGARQTVETVVLMKNEITGWFVGTGEPQLTGPIGIAQLTSEVAGLGILPLVELAALLSLNLSILNILPLPALDGGRLLFLAIEVVRRGKRVPPKKEALVHLAGFIILITAVVIISYFDIVRIAHGQSIIGG